MYFGLYIFATIVFLPVFIAQLSARLKSIDAQPGRYGPEVTDEDRDICSAIRFKEIGSDKSHLTPGYKDWISQQMLSWPASLECCILHDYELLPMVTLSTRRKYLKIPTAGAWVSANDMANEGDWAWPSGEQIYPQLWLVPKVTTVSKKLDYLGSLMSTQNIQRNEQCGRIVLDESKQVKLKDERCDLKTFFICREKTKNRRTELSLTRNMTIRESQLCLATNFIQLKKSDEYLSNSRLPWIAAKRCCEYWGLKLLPLVHYDDRHLYSNIADHAWVGGKDIKKETNWTWLTGVQVDPRLWGDDSSHRMNRVDKCTLLRYHDGQVELTDYNCRVSYHFICQGESERVKVTLDTSVPAESPTSVSISSYIGKTDISVTNYTAAKSTEMQVTIPKIANHQITENQGKGFQIGISAVGNMRNYEKFGSMYSPNVNRVKIAKAPEITIANETLSILNSSNIEKFKNSRIPIMNLKNSKRFKVGKSSEIVMQNPHKLAKSVVLARQENFPLNQFEVTTLKTVETKLEPTIRPLQQHKNLRKKFRSKKIGRTKLNVHRHRRIGKPKEKIIRHKVARPNRISIHREKVAKSPKVKIYEPKVYHTKASTIGIKSYSIAKPSDAKINYFETTISPVPVVAKLRNSVDNALHKQNPLKTIINNKNESTRRPKGKKIRKQQLLEHHGAEKSITGIITKNSFPSFTTVKRITTTHRTTSKIFQMSTPPTISTSARTEFPTPSTSTEETPTESSTASTITTTLFPTETTSETSSTTDSTTETSSTTDSETSSSSTEFTTTEGPTIYLPKAETTTEIPALPRRRSRVKFPNSRSLIGEDSPEEDEVTQTPQQESKTETSTICTSIVTRWVTVDETETATSPIAAVTTTRKSRIIYSNLWPPKFKPNLTFQPKLITTRRIKRPNNYFSKPSLNTGKAGRGLGTSKPNKVIYSCPATSFKSLTPDIALSNDKMPWKMAQQCCEWFNMHLLFTFDAQNVPLKLVVDSPPYWLSNLKLTSSGNSTASQFDNVTSECPIGEFDEKVGFKSSSKNCDSKLQFICQEYKRCEPKTSVSFPESWTNDPTTEELLHDSVLALKYELKFLSTNVPGPKLPPTFEPYKYLQMSRVIFSTACSNEVVPNYLIKMVFRIFRYLLVQQYDSYHSHRRLFNDPTRPQRIMNSLIQCYENTQPFEFNTNFERQACSKLCEDEPFFKNRDNVTVYCECQNKLTAKIAEKSNLLTKWGNTFDLKFVDFVVEFIWKIIMFTHFHCAEFFNANPMDLSYFYYLLEDLFDPKISLRWRNINRLGNPLWRSYFFGHSLNRVAVSVDSCVEAAVVSSKYTGKLKRPIEF